MTEEPLQDVPRTDATQGEVGCAEIHDISGYDLMLAAKSHYRTAILDARDALDSALDYLDGARNLTDERIYGCPLGELGAVIVARSSLAQAVIKARLETEEGDIDNGRSD